MFTVEH